jgi:hypothetical protein
MRNAHGVRFYERKGGKPGDVTQAQVSAWGRQAEGWGGRGGGWGAARPRALQSYCSCIVCRLVCSWLAQSIGAPASLSPTRYAQVDEVLRRHDPEAYDLQQFESARAEGRLVEYWASKQELLASWTGDQGLAARLAARK